MEESTCMRIFKKQLKGLKFSTVFHLGGMILTMKNYEWGINFSGDML